MHGLRPHPSLPVGASQTWYDVTSVPRVERPHLDYVAEADACIVGGGLSVLTLARELAKRGWAVVVLEADRIASGASGRHGGFVLPGFAQDQAEIEKRVGFEQAKALYDLSRAGVDYVRHTIEDTRMPGVALQPGVLHLVREANRVDEFRAKSEQFIRRYGPGPLFWSQERVREAVNSSRYKAGLYDGSGFHIHALNYSLGLAADAARRGVRIFEQTPATGFDMRSIRRIVLTPQGAVRCNRIILCSAASLASAVYPRVAGAFLPILTHIGVTEPLGSALPEAIRFRGALIDTRNVGDYFRLLEDGRLLWGAGVSIRERQPKALRKAIAKAIAGAFPQLKGTAVEFAWSGTMAYAPHRMPVIAEVERDIFVTSGFGGHGLNTTAMAATILAETLAHHGKRHHLFARYGLQPRYGALGRIAARLNFWQFRRRDRMAGGGER